MIDALDILINLGWFLLWVLTLGCSLVTAHGIATDNDFNTNELVAAYLATPVLWAILICFYFN